MPFRRPPCELADLPIVPGAAVRAWQISRRNTGRMNPFECCEGRLHADGIPVEAIAAAGTPTCIYSATAMRAAFGRLRDAFSPLGAHLHYAVKAYPNTNLLKLHRLGIVQANCFSPQVPEPLVSGKCDSFGGSRAGLGADGLLFRVGRGVRE